MTDTTTPTHGPPDNSNRVFLLAVVGLVMAGLAAVAFVATRSGDDVDLAEDQTASVTTDGTALAGLPEGVAVGVEGNDPVVGQVAPTLEGTDFAGDTVRIEADGRAKAVYFLAHWCPHCQAEVPAIQDLIDAGSKPDNLDLYAVSTAVDAGQGNFPPQSWLDREGFEPTVVRDDEAASAFAAFGGSGFPYVIFLDGDNQVVARAAGNLEPAAIVELWEMTASSAG